ncbi:PepSY-like domain-containing protein [Zunongwangia sp. HGR-M22]|uniref:PepSY-like domain-containing protein n=1 Tax=Zunongwangia sp. HGR-M22 TaxID=3015168 RepID=UPI0022DDE8D3|nr:PepSY-like domain-containing protein [Zunongwangia sp. HGR-M22]WBL26734.1 PepSY-like domain-containing protein [Zunongwangia sp. HGR-M22]
MKKQILILGAALTMVSSLQAQEIAQNKVPSVIVNEFNKSFPAARDVEWKLEANQYNVEFELDRDNDHELSYNKQGKLVKHKEDIAEKDLPNSVIEKIKSEFNGYSIDDLEKVNDNGKIYYHLDLEALFKEDWEITIDDKGSIISKKAD